MGVCFRSCTKWIAGPPPKRYNQSEINRSPHVLGGAAFATPVASSRVPRSFNSPSARVDVARLHEHQGKALLQALKIPTPKGRLAQSVDEARKIGEELARPVVVKGQAWVTGRADLGAIRFAGVVPHRSWRMSAERSAWRLRAPADRE